ncbi:antibiotic biosynthesis monooxygenase family protein [Streptomyces acidicola]|uniref:antibiotic biosynthesis monooxygenase family protein n=1 Tax=Streptomyces acidicola TaxID=2596892 RepID=UPI003819CBF7
MTGPTTRQPYRIMLRMEIRPGMEGEFERAWLAIGDSVTSHPANLGQSLARDTEEKGRYYIISDWVDEPSFREFETSARHLEHRRKLHPYRSAGTMTTMQVTAQVPGSQPGTTHAEWESE